MKLQAVLFFLFSWGSLALAGLGNVVVIQGSSSCGKTTTAKALQKALAERDSPFLLLGIDQFMQALPAAWVNIDAAKAGAVRADGLRFVRHDDKQGAKLLAEIGPVVARARSGAWAAVASFAKAGNNVILEGAFLPEEIETGERELKGYKPLFAIVRCSLQVAERREKERGGFPGLARGTAEMLGQPKPGQFSVTVDTTEKSPEDGASLILAELQKRL